MKRILITVSGKDKPGIIAKVTGLLYARGCNLEDVSMTLLEGQFAMMMTVCVLSQASLNRILEALEVLEASPWSMDFHVTLLKGKAYRGRKHALGSLPHIITAFGRDRTGIVYSVSRALAGFRINITDLDSRILGAGLKTTYAMILEVDVPKSVNPSKLKRLLAGLAKRLKIEIQLKPLDRVSL
ncbi:MAG: ACT domain-containing protein [Candidatus Omnitrophica bacterium]|nr:ACT domain-containing protein [Candidatus Omnitrophota bacterium]